MMDGKVLSSSWVASYKDLGISKADVEALHAMSKAQQEMMSSLNKGPLANMANLAKSSPLAFEEMGGFPMITKVFMNGRAISETHVRQVKSEALDEGLFEVPKGYSKQEMPAMAPPADAGRRPKINIPGLFGR